MAKKTKTKKKAERAITTVVTESEAREIRLGLGLRKAKLEKESGTMEGLGIPTADVSKMLAVYVGNGKGSGLLYRFEVASEGQGDLLATPTPNGKIDFLDSHNETTDSVLDILEKIRTGQFTIEHTNGAKIVDAEGRMFSVSAFAHAQYEYLGVRCAWDRDGDGCEEVIADDQGKLCFAHRKVVWDEDLEKLEAKKIIERITELEQYITDADNETAKGLATETKANYEARLAELQKDGAEEPEGDQTFESVRAELDLKFTQAASIIAKDRLPVENLGLLVGVAKREDGLLTKTEVEKVIGEWVASQASGPEPVN